MARLTRGGSEATLCCHKPEHSPLRGAKRESCPGGGRGRAVVWARAEDPFKSSEVRGLLSPGPGGAFVGSTGQAHPAPRESGLMSKGSKGLLSPFESRRAPLGAHFVA